MCLICLTTVSERCCPLSQTCTNRIPLQSRKKSSYISTGSPLPLRRTMVELQGTRPVNYNMSFRLLKLSRTASSSLPFSMGMQTCLSVSAVQQLPQAGRTSQTEKSATSMDLLILGLGLDQSLSLSLVLASLSFQVLETPSGQVDSTGTCGLGRPVVRLPLALQPLLVTRFVSTARL